MQGSYIESLCRSLKALKIGATPNKAAKSKCKLVDLLNGDVSNDGAETDNGAGCSTKYMKKAVFSDDDLEDVSSALRHSSISDKTFQPPEVKETLSKVKNKNKKKENKSKRH